MKLTPVDQIPKMNGYHKLQELIEEFIHGRRGTMDEGSEQEVSNGTAQTDTPEVRQNHIRRLQEGKEGPLTQRLFLFFHPHKRPSPLWRQNFLGGNQG